MKASLFFASACAAILFPAYGQLYLIQGSPTPKYNLGYPTSLLQVGSDGSVRAVSEILPGSGSMGGAEWIGVSYDHRKAVFLSKYPSHTIVIVDFDSASVIKSCAAPPPPAGMSSFPFEEWLADIPGQGLTFVEELGTDGLKTAADAARAESVLREMRLDASIACRESFATSPKRDAKFLVSSGEAGVADLGSDTRMDVGIEKSGALAMHFLGSERTYFDYRVPDNAMADVTRPIASIVLNNSHAFAVTVSDTASGRSRLLIFRKSDNTWNSVPEFGAFLVRGFGSFVAIAETQPKTAQNAESTGRAEWRKAESAAGPSIEARLKDLPYVLPGKLDLYDVATEKIYRIVTNQGDSEILLVDHNTVYYRVSDRLYSAAIGENGLAPGRLIATSESIRDVHWAFIKD